MRYTRFGSLVFLTIVSASPLLLAQRGGRGANAAAQQAGAEATPAPAAAQTGTGAAQAGAGRGGRGGAGAAATGGAAADEFYTFDPTAAQVRPDPGADRPPVETHQKVTVGGQTLAYTTRAGFLGLPNATTGSTEAQIFFTSYTKDGASDGPGRPIVCFVGGAPGVSAAWQEFGGFGPKRMKPEGGWGDNADTLLSQADLVFVNPVGTGFSYATQPARASVFWNTAGDIASLGAFVRLYLDRYNRIGAPLFVAAEDAATGRAAGLTEYLTDHMIPVKGVILLSATPAADATAGDAQYITLFPSLVMASWYHKKLAPEMNSMSAEQIAGQARQFASRGYLHALYKGDRMSAEEKAKVVAEMARLTGLSKAFIVNNELRITLDRYSAEILKEQKESLSRSDARVSGYVPGAGGRGGFGRGGRGGQAGGVDYNMSKIAAPFATAYAEYLKRELTFSPRKDGIFYLNSGGVGAFTSTGNDDASLTAAFVRNPNLKLFLGIDSFDLSSPFYVTEYTLAHLDVSPDVRSHNITVSHQEAGSMAYLDSKASVKIQRDLAGFIAGAAK